VSNEIEGKTNLTAGIAPFSEDDVFETHTDIYGKGGFRVVEDIEARDNIPKPRRKEKMLVAIKDDHEVYQLVGGIENEHWEPFNLESEDLINTLEELEKAKLRPTGFQVVQVDDENYQLQFSYSDHPNLSHFIIEKKDPNTGEWKPYDGEVGRVEP